MEKTTQQDNIGVFKLSSGEEVVSEFSNLTADNITFVCPRAVIIGRDQKTGHVGIQLGPWILTEQDDDFIVDRRHIMTMKITDLDPGLIQAYLKNTTGIDVQTAAGNLFKP